MNRFLGVLAIGCLMGLVAACGGASSGGSGDADVAAAAARVKGGMDAEAGPVRAMSTQTAATDAARDEAAKALGVPASQVNVERVEPVQWRDASLGCDPPSQVSPPVVTAGLRFVVSAGGQRREVHSDGASRMVVCQNPTQ
jgi:hypothetical protein